MKTNRILVDGRRGSILLLVVITMSMLSLFAVGATANSSTLIDSARSCRGQLHARIAAESAVAYVHRQLQLDQDWTGTHGAVYIASGVCFDVAVIPGAGGAGEAVFTVSAEADGARVMLEPVYGVGVGGAPTIEHALALLGGDANMNSVEVFGDMAIANTEEGVLDWDPVAQEFVPMTGGDPNIEANSVTVHGDLMSNTGNISGVGAGSQGALESPLLNPGWNLDAYLAGGSDVSLYLGQHNFNGLSTSNTIVVVSDAGQNIHFENCNIEGGVVIWSPSGWDPRGSVRNTVTFNSSSFGLDSGAPGRTFGHIGMIAPNAGLGDSGNSLDEGQGMFWFKEIQRLNSANITKGALICTGDAIVLNSINVTWDPELSGFMFEGMVAGPPVVVLKSVKEFFDSPTGGSGGQAQSY